jgi:hypothetical protein
MMGTARVRHGGALQPPSLERAGREMRGYRLCILWMKYRTAGWPSKMPTVPPADGADAMLMRVREE